MIYILNVCNLTIFKHFTQCFFLKGIDFTLRVNISLPIFTIFSILKIGGYVYCVKTDFDMLTSHLTFASINTLN